MSLPLRAGPWCMTACLCACSCPLQTKFGYTALHLAAKVNDHSLCKWLCQKGIDTRLRDLEGWTALHWASSLGYIECVRVLLEQGADPNVHIQQTIKEAEYNAHVSRGFDPRVSS